MAKRTKNKKHDRLQKSVRSILTEASQLLRHGDVKAAHKLASEVFLRAKQEADKKSARELFVESSFRLALKTQPLQEKLDLLEAVLKISPEDMRLRFQLGIALLQDGRAIAALHEFNAVAEREPTREGLAFFRQLALSASGKQLKKTTGLSAAEKNTLALLEIFGEKPSKTTGKTSLPSNLIGNTPELWELLLKMRHDRSFAPADDLQKVADDSPSNLVSAIARYYQGVAAMRNKQEDSAFIHWRDALKAGFAPLWCRKNIALSCRQDLLEFAEKNRWHDIINTIQRLPKTFEDETLNQIHALALFNLGYKQAEQDKWSKAIEYWQEASKKGNSRYLAQNLALAREKREQWELAAQSWKDMLRRKPRKTDHPDYVNEKQVAIIWEHISDCYHNAFQDYEALDALWKAVESNPGNLERRFKYVSACENLNNMEGAVRGLEAILDLAPDNFQALTQLAHYYKKQPGRDPRPLWKKILTLDPDNSEARNELAHDYIDRAFPPSKGKWFIPKTPPYKKQLAILQEGLELLPNHPNILLAFGWAHLDAGKNRLAKDALLNAYQKAPKDPHIASSVLQDLIHLKEVALIEKLIPEIQQNPALLPRFWIDQGIDALAQPNWAERFFNAALEQVAFADKRSPINLTSTLVDIVMALRDKPGCETLQQNYTREIEDKVPQSGALEYLDAFMSYEKTGDQKKAQRLLRKAKKLASAANETLLLKHIEEGELFLSGRLKTPLDSFFGPDMPPLPKDMQGMMEEMQEMMAEIERTEGPQALDQLMKQMLKDFEAFGGMDDGEFF